MSTIRPNIK